MNPRYFGLIYDKLSLITKRLPLNLLVRLESWGRYNFTAQFSNHTDIKNYVPPAKHRIKLWGMDFRNPLANAAGVFKNGEGYDTVAKLGAGAYLGGTSTANPRYGNMKNGVYLPFIRLPESRSAINYLGLPNLGDEVLSKRIITENKLADCPIGWSVMRSPDYPEAQGLTKLVAGLWAYHDNPQIDFLELNESCPNINLGGGSIIPRLQFIAEQFLAKRKRQLPVIVKLSNDLMPESLATILDALIRYRFDGITLGNTSVDYACLRRLVKPCEQKLFDYFTQEFGGGVSGALLKSRSLQICGVAAEYLAKLKPDHEFHIIRSGGIENPADLAASKEYGVSFNYWYTGFFNAYFKNGDKLYRRILADNF